MAVPSSVSPGADIVVESGQMDKELVVRAQQGELQAFEALVSSAHPRLYRVALGVLREPALAADATQQALIEIWRYLPRLRDPSKFDSWSYKVLVRACGAQARTTPRWLPTESIPPAQEPTMAGTYYMVDDRDQLERAFRRLSVDHRAVIVMRHLLDLPHDQIAAALGISVGTVGSRLNRAREALRAALEADERAPEPLTHARVSER